MHRIELTSEEAEVLRDILQHHIRDMDIEVFRTDTHDFKEKLKHRRQILENLELRLEHMPVAA